MVNKSKGGGNCLAFFTIVSNVFTTLLYVHHDVQSSAHSTQPSGLSDFTIVAQGLNQALDTFHDLVLPVDPDAGSTSGGGSTDQQLEDEEPPSSGTTSSTAVEIGCIYVGPHSSTDDNYQVIAERVKLDITSRDLATTTGGKTNVTTIKAIGQKPAASTTVAGAKFAAASGKLATVTDQTITATTLRYRDWVDAV